METMTAYTPDLVRATADCGLSPAMTLHLVSGQFSKVELRAYWRTNHFARLKVACLEQNPCCVVCGRTDRLTVNHLNYAHLFAERIGIDAVTTCSPCNGADYRRRRRRR